MRLRVFQLRRCGSMPFQTINIMFSRAWLWRRLSDTFRNCWRHRKVTCILRSTKKTIAVRTSGRRANPCFQVKTTRHHDQDFWHKWWIGNESFYRPNREVPKNSSCGNQYITVLCKIDSSGILVKPLRNKLPGKPRALLKKHEQIGQTENKNKTYFTWQ